MALGERAIKRLPGGDAFARHQQIPGENGIPGQLRPGGQGVEDGDAGLVQEARVCGKARRRQTAERLA